MKAPPMDLAGIRPRVQEARLDVARAILAARRHDALAAEVHLRNAQLALLAVEMSLPRQEGSS